MSKTDTPADAKPIEVNGQVVDPQEHYARYAQNTDHIIVTARDVLNVDQRAQLQKLHVEFLEDLGHHNFLCRYKPSDLAPIRELSFIRQVDVYRNLYKIPAVLTSLTESLRETPQFETESYPIDVMVHQGIGNLDKLVHHISKVAHVDQSQMEITPDKIRLRVKLGELEAIAADDRVRVIEEVVTPVLFDDEAKRLVYMPLQAQGQVEFSGKGQTIAVVDSGFDLGSVEDCHPAFVGQIEKLIPLGRASDQDKTDTQKVDDPKGHGTHVCGTIVGKEIKTSQGAVGGVAQEAKLILSSLEKDDGDLLAVTKISSLYEVPYKTYHAHVHSNSWGDGLGLGEIQRPYGHSASDLDDFVRTHPDALICFSAGNNNQYINKKILSGIPKPSIGSQASAKNCLTIGASGSTRVVSIPEKGQADRLDPDQICLDSSRGPTIEKRTKPDVVAPGFNIFSAHSRHPRAAKFSAPEAISESYPTVVWKARSGTSHATPLVSGCAAILRQILQSKGFPSPPAALIKAVLINGADKLPGVDVAAQGFGRINLNSSIAILQSLPVLPEKFFGPSLFGPSLSPTGGSLIGPPLQQDAIFTFDLPSAPGSDEFELKITLVYNDLPGGAIQNNLNLIVKNNVTDVTKIGAISEDEIEVQNNVEQVVWDPAPKELVTVSVRAQKIFPGSEQDFVLAWSTTAPYGGVKKHLL